MIGWRRTTPCERASHWISIDLDGELSEVEQAGLARHLERCEACRLLSAELAGLTGLLRSSALVEPGDEFAFPRARGNRARRVSVLAYAGVAIAIVTTVAIMATSRPTGLDRGSAVPVALANDQQQFQFASTKVNEIEPSDPTVIDVSVPGLAHRALR